MGEFTKLVQTVFHVLPHGNFPYCTNEGIRLKIYLKIIGFHIPFGEVSWTFCCGGYSVI
jgi:hypothetical protein